MNKVKNYSKEEQEIVVNILLLAFSSDPFQRYLMPDPSVFFKNSTIWFNNAASKSILLKSLFKSIASVSSLFICAAVSYTHLTLPTIYSV